MALDRQNIDNTVDQKVARYQEIALAIHGKPEVSNYEFFACETLAKQLEAEGFDVTGATSRGSPARPSSSTQSTTRSPVSGTPAGITSSAQLHHWRRSV